MRLLSRVPLAAALCVGGCIDYGVTRHVQTDSWTQPTREKGVDILWVIDDSSSMLEEQGQLAEHAGSFISFLSTVAVDFRLGMVTTDMEGDYAGQLIGELLAPDSEDLTETFAILATFSTEGSRDERGFDAALQAFDPSLDAFGRSDADIEVIFFSDEDDHSDMEAEAFVAALQALRPGVQVKVNAVVGDLPEGCASLLAAADPGELYVEAQALTGGLRESICSADYAAMLQRVALAVLGLDDRFALSRVPDLDSMEVKVDGVTLYQRERHGWTYDPGENLLILDGYAVPQPGAELSARYYEWLGTETPELEDTAL